jgi:hypothetical protein
MSGYKFGKVACRDCRFVLLDEHGGLNGCNHPKVVWHTFDPLTAKVVNHGMSTLMCQYPNRDGKCKMVEYVRTDL